MCGISAVVDYARSSESVRTLLRMHAPIPHRGPDAERFLIIDGDWQPHLIDSAEAVPQTAMIAGVAFRRLRIVDLSDAASQPMATADRSIWIAFNGEIYNFKGLREQLSAQGRQFGSHSDTEVALAAYETWGTRAFEVLDGMWAIVIVDLTRRKLVISRDRLGMKPVVWAHDGSRLLIASETKQILASKGERPAPNAHLIARFLQGNRIPVLDETFFDDIQPFPQASLVEVALDIEDARRTPQRFWSLSSVVPRPLGNSDYGQSVDELDEALTRAVDTHNLADVRVGYLLSGGLDSSLLTGIMATRARASAQTVAPTFSFGFRGRGSEFSELPYAEAVARKHALTLHETTFDASWIASNAGRVIRAVEEPSLGLPALAQFRIYELCRDRGMTVVIGGEASDEVFAGYPGYQSNLLGDYFNRGRFLSLARELRAIARRQRTSMAAAANNFVLRPLRNHRTITNGWFNPSFGESEVRSAAIREALADYGGHATRVGRCLYRDVWWGNVKMVVTYTDRFAMANSIEARVPYLDLAVLSLAFSLPDEYKAGNGERKRILRDVARRYLPAEVTERTDRMGFGTPDVMLLSDMWPDIEARVLGIANATPFRRGEVEHFLKDYREGVERDARAVWRLYALARWMEEFGVVL